MTEHTLAGALEATSSSGIFQWAETTVAKDQLHGAAHAGWTIGVVHLTEARTKAELFAAFQRDLGFPKWFGHNWDALVDALADWHGHARHRLVVIEHVESHDHGYPIEPLLDVVTAVTAAAMPAASPTPTPGSAGSATPGSAGSWRYVVVMTSPTPLEGVRPLV